MIFVWDASQEFIPCLFRQPENSGSAEGMERGSLVILKILLCHISGRNQRYSRIYGTVKISREDAVNVITGIYAADAEEMPIF